VLTDDQSLSLYCRGVHVTCDITSFELSRHSVADSGGGDERDVSPAYSKFLPMKNTTIIYKYGIINYNGVKTKVKQCMACSVLL